MRVEPVVQLLARQLAHQHHRVSHRPVRSVRVRHPVQGNRYFIQVLLPVNPGCVHEILVLGHPLRRLQVLAKKGMNGLEIDVENPIGLRQQPCCLRRSLRAQEHRNRQQQHYSRNNKKRSSSPSGHQEPSDLRYHCREEILLVRGKAAKSDRPAGCRNGPALMPTADVEKAASLPLYMCC